MRAIRHILPLGACMALTLAHGTALANISAAAVLGTTGLGAQLEVPLSPQMQARFGANALNYDYTGSTTFTTYDIGLRLRTVDALLDWYPGAGGLRLTAGAIVNRSRVDPNGRPSITGSYTFRDRTYSVSDIGEVDGRIDVRRFAPYLGIGWSSRASDRGGWRFTSDLGVIFQGTPRLTLESTGCDLGRGLLGRAICDRLRSDLASETEQAREEIRNYRYYPVVRIGLAYQF